MVELGACWDCWVCGKAISLLGGTDYWITVIQLRSTGLKSSSSVARCCAGHAATLSQRLNVSAVSSRVHGGTVRQNSG